MATLMVRVVVILAVIYLARYTLAHQDHTQSKEPDSYKEDSASVSEGSNEKILFKSGFPLRGRKIHHTAWSEEEKVSVPEKDTTEDHDTSEERFYDKWSLTKAINYILSFIYDTEVEGHSILSDDSVEILNKNLKLAEIHSNETKIRETSKKAIGPNGKSGNIPAKDKNEEIILESTSSHISGNFPELDIKRFQNGIDSLDKEDTDVNTENENSNELFEPSNSEYEVTSTENVGHGTVNQESGGHVDIKTILIDNEDEYVRKNFEKISIEDKENALKLDSGEKSSESLEEEKAISTMRYKEGNLHPKGTTKTSFGYNNKNGETGLPKKKYANHYANVNKSKIPKEFIGTESLAGNTNFEILIAEPVSKKESSKEKSIRHDLIDSNGSDSDEEDNNRYTVTERNSLEKLSIKVKPATYPQSQTQVASSKTYSHRKNEKMSNIVDDNKKQEIKKVTNHLIANIRNSNKTERMNALKTPIYGIRTTAKSTVIIPTKRHHLNVLIKNDKKLSNSKGISIAHNKSLETHLKPSPFRTTKSLKNKELKHLKEVYWNIEPDEEVRSYNYILDSYEFIRVDTNNNKVNKKHDNLKKVKEIGAAKKVSQTVSTSLPSLKYPRKVEPPVKTRENYDTILEYLYKNSNNSLLLSLKKI